jgi:ABC-2 type transport system ATP-binding protein
MIAPRKGARGADTLSLTGQHDRHGILYGMTSTDGLALATRGLVKRYGKQTALAGLDLSVPSGVVYGFLGPNGAGKTTTMRLLTGLIHPDGGTIELLGRPFGRRDRKRLFDVGALIESPSFYPYLSARENLRSLAATGAPTAKGRIDELLEFVGLRDRARDRVSTYSLGMKQRLGIAAALLSDPRLLLLDEPSNGLDPAGIVGMRETLKQLAASGKTVFVSSHVLGEVQQLADVIGIIADGRLVREGPIEQLLQGEGLVRVRLDPAELESAVGVLGRLAGEGTVSRIEGEDGWLSVRIEPDRAAEVNRALATAGIYASGLETGSDLEQLFLELTRTAPPAGPEGPGIVTPAAPVPPGWGSAGGPGPGGGDA